METKISKEVKAKLTGEQLRVLEKALPEISVERRLRIGLEVPLNEALSYWSGEEVKT